MKTIQFVLCFLKISFLFVFAAADRDVSIPNVELEKYKKEHSNFLPNCFHILIAILPQTLQRILSKYEFELESKIHSCLM